MKFINNLTDRIFGPAADTRIIGLLIELATVGENASDVLSRTKCKDGESVIRFEQHGDKLVVQIQELLDGTYQPRYFSKQDIGRLVYEIDDIVDGMRHTVNHVELYACYFKGDSLPHSAMRLLEIIQEMTATVVTLVAMMQSRHMPIAHVRELSSKLKAAERVADRILRRVKKALFWRYKRLSGDPIEYIAWKEFFGQLERITDSANHCGNQILSIAHK